MENKKVMKKHHRGQEKRKETENVTDYISERRRYSVS
jgi:hypothetical protein